MTNVKVLHLLLTFQGPNFYMMAVLDYFIEIIFLFCNLIVGKTKINKKKLRGGRGEDIHFEWTSKDL